MRKRRIYIRVLCVLKRDKTYSLCFLILFNLGTNDICFKSETIVLLNLNSIFTERYLINIIIIN
jgi:hypothetical protein